EARLPVACGQLALVPSFRPPSRTWSDRAVVTFLRVAGVTSASSAAGFPASPPEGCHRITAPPAGLGLFPARRTGQAGARTQCAGASGGPAGPECPAS